MLGSLILAIHMVVCIALVIVVLLQHGKGADIGAVFGGSSQTVFGSSGAGNFLTRLTSALAVVFFATSISLAYASSRHVTASVFDRPFPGRAAPVQRVPVVPAPAAPAAPAAPVAPAPAPAPNK